jgi:hypothetical protein
MSNETYEQQQLRITSLSSQMAPCPFCQQLPKIERQTKYWEVSDRDMGGFGSGTSTMSRSWEEIVCSCGITFYPNVADEARKANGLPWDKTPSQAQLTESMVKRWNERKEPVK